MIINRGYEAIQEIGTKKVGLEGLIRTADEMETKWNDDFVSGYQAFPLMLTKDGDVQYLRNGSESVKADLTENAFSQICQRAGVPSVYMRKCLASGRGELAAENFSSWAQTATKDPVSIRVRMYDGIVHAVLTPQYNPFDHPEILYGIQKAVGNDGRYEANEAFLSPDRMHIRFVDFNNPLNVNNDKLYSGFTVSSSNIGDGAFSIKYFLYRFACRNGMVRIQHGGVLFRQTHLKEFLQDGESLFRDAIDQMHVLDRISEQQINVAMGKKLSIQELGFYLDKAQKELGLGKKGRQEAEAMIGSVYDQTLWGLANTITERAKSYTLDTRLNMEQWAGNLLSAA